MHKSGKQLVQWPILELEKLRMGRVNVPSKLLKGGSRIEVSGLTAAQVDLLYLYKITLSFFITLTNLTPNRTILLHGRTIYKSVSLNGSCPL